MKCRDAELEALEWGGLLHDIGKIGIADAVLLKPDKLNREERIRNERAPGHGRGDHPAGRLAAGECRSSATITSGTTAPGTRTGWLGEEIPRLARIIHVADALEAMTSPRPYRMVPLTPEQALAELRKYAGIQFDPTVVDAFARTKWAAGIPDPGRPLERQPIPMLSQAASRMARAGAAQIPGAGAEPLADPGSAGDPL